MPVCHEQFNRRAGQGAEQDRPARPQSVTMLLGSHLITAGGPQPQASQRGAGQPTVGWHQALTGTRASCTVTRGRQSTPLHQDVPSQRGLKGECPSLFPIHYVSRQNPDIPALFPVLCSKMWETPCHSLMEWSPRPV